MCGRFGIAAPKEVLEKRFHACFTDEYSPRYNAAPAQKLPVILNTEPGRIRMIPWGIKPSWEKTSKMLINARAESLWRLPTFRELFKKRRCLVLADGYYEWKRRGGQNQPYRFELKDRKLFAFAGLWEDGGKEESFLIVTTKPNKVSGKIHNRMPAILREAYEHSWLSELIDPEEAQNYFLPYPDELMRAYTVSDKINSAKYDSPDLISEVN